jgi:hypothetical protein
MADATPAEESPAMPFVAAFGCFSLLFAGSMLGALKSDDVDFLRTHATAWSMALLATPPMYIFVSRYRREPLDDWWRMFWSFGWLMNIAHFYFGLFHLHDGDPLSVFERQGFLLAFSIFFFTGLWGIDVAAAWLRPSWAPPYGIIDSLAFVVGFLTFFISTVIFNNDRTSFVIGLIMSGAVLAAVIRRLLPPSTGVRGPA